MDMNAILNSLLPDMELQFIFNPILPVKWMAVICGVLLLCKRKGFWAFLRQALMLMLLFIINLRPMIPGKPPVAMAQKMETQVIFVIDDTISMIAGDGPDEKSRLDAVKEDCAYIVDSLEGAKFTAISFHNEARVIVPFTDNGFHVKNAINSLSVLSQYHARGTAMKIVKDQLLEAAKRAKEDNTKQVYVFYMGDGEITKGKKLGDYEEVTQYIDGGAVLGYGTEEGSVMMVPGYDYETEEEIMEPIMDYSDYPTKAAITRIDEDNLKALAETLELSYLNRNKKESLDTVIQSILDSAQVSLEEEDSSNDLDYAEDTYFYLVLALMVLVLYEGLALAFRKR